MLSREQQREILALALLALALFMVVSLVPVSLLGERGMEWFPSGNAMGVVGATMRALLTAFLGSFAFLVPLMVAVGGVRAGEWLSPERSLRYALLGLGLASMLRSATRYGCRSDHWLPKPRLYPTVTPLRRRRGQLRFPRSFHILLVALPEPGLLVCCHHLRDHRPLWPTVQGRTRR